MDGSIEKRLKELNIQLPKVAPPAGNIVPAVKTGSLVFLSGQATLLDGEAKFLGKVGREIDLEQAKQATRLCVLNLLAQLRGNCGGDLDRVARVVKLNGYINATEDFKDIPQAVNGASDLLVELFGPAGAHARTAIGVNALPRGVAAVVEAVFELK